MAPSVAMMYCEQMGTLMMYIPYIYIYEYILVSCFEAHLTSADSIHSLFPWLNPTLEASVQRLKSSMVFSVWSRTAHGQLCVGRGDVLVPHPPRNKKPETIRPHPVTVVVHRKLT